MKYNTDLMPTDVRNFNAEACMIIGELNDELLELKKSISKAKYVLGNKQLSTGAKIDLMDSLGFMEKRVAHTVSQIGKLDSRINLAISTRQVY